jgi:Zn-dependent protease with chaperone function
MIAAVLLILPTLAQAADSSVKLDGALEFRKADYMIIDGQRVKATPTTKVKGAASAAKIPLGYLTKVQGTRDAQGTVLATEINATANTVSGSESQILAGANLAESTWVAAGAIVESDANGKQQSMGALHKTGPEVDRVRKIVDRVMPPYVDRSKVRVYVVDNPEWNAMAMPNYSIYVFSGILKDLNDDEMALVLGHEIAHATMEHSRRQQSKGKWSQIAGQAAMVGASKLGSSTARTVAQQATSLGYSAFNNSYSRDYEDQADRIGMRYAYEAGYDYTKGPELWHKFAAKYGDKSKVENFFYGNHSVSADRAKNLEREIKNNYTGNIDPATKARTTTASTTTKATTTTTTKK